MFAIKQTIIPDNQMSILCSCGKGTKFFGIATPIVCHHCNNILPDGMELYRTDEERVVYHLDEEIFVD